MGVISAFIGFYSFKGIKSIQIKFVKNTNTGLSMAAFTGAWLALFIPALACTVELWFAGTFPLIQGLLFMGLYHAVIGVVAEGAITAIVVTTIAAHRSDLFAFAKDYKLKGVAST
jgi:cobalt/nickel transport system permease protein